MSYWSTGRSTVRGATEVGTKRTVAVVLTYRRPRLATQSVRYLVEEEGMRAEDIIVVVNGVGGLDDDDLANQVTMLVLDSNRGPAGGMRAGLEAAAEDADVEWIYLCEDDIGASGLPGSRLETVRKMAEEHEHISGRPIGGVVAYSRQMDKRTGLTRPHLPAYDDTGLIPTDVASWGASLVSRRVVDAGILPDDTLFFGYEDFDFWLTMQASGFDVVLDAACARQLGRTVHPSGREEALGGERPIDDAEPWRRYYEARNFMHLRRAHGHIGWTAAHLVKSARRARMGSRPHHRAILDGLVDGFRRRTGLNPKYLRPDNSDERPVGPTTGGSS